MEKKTKAKVFSIITIVVMVVIITFVLSIIMPGPNCCMCGDTANKCCPCPNPELIDLVEDHTGQRASSAGSWLSMCEKYQRDTNDTRMCFE